MAYMSQERKRMLEPAIKAICKRHGVKATLSVRHHSTLILTVTESPIDFRADVVPDFFAPDRYAAIVSGDDMDVNVYHFRRHFGGKALAFLEEVIDAMNVGNHDRSDLMTDYFDVGWYVEVTIGKHGKPYRVALIAPVGA
jgi:hypothetical protein